MINCLFIDCAAFLLYLATKNLFNRMTGFIAFILFIFSLGLSPWILTPYTDTLVLPFVCATIYCYSVLYKNRMLSLAYKILLVFFIRCFTRGLFLNEAFFNHIFCCFWLCPATSTNLFKAAKHAEVVTYNIQSMFVIQHLYDFSSISFFQRTTNNYCH